MKKIFFERLVVNIIVSIFLLILALKLKNEKMIFMIIFFMFLFHLLMTIRTTYKRFKKIHSYNKEIISKIDKELTDSILDRVDYTLTKSYIFNKGSFDIIFYEDIFLIQNSMTFSLGLNSLFYPCTYLVTKNGNYCLVNYSMNFYDKDIRILDLYDFIIYKNNKVLINDTKENIKILKDKYQIDLKKNWKIKSIRNLRLIRLW